MSIKARITLAISLGLASVGQLTAQSPAQSWDSIKAATFPVLAPAFASDYGTPYRMALSDYGWEDGPQLSQDGLDFYALYSPMDLFSSTAYIVNHPGLPFCDLLGNMDFVRPYAGTYGMDLATNPYGCDSFLNIDLLYAHRNTTQDSFQTWQLSGVARPGFVEGSPAPMPSLADPNLLDMFMYSGSGDLWVIQNTARNPGGINNAIRLPSPINPVSNEFSADNAYLARLQGDSVLLAYEHYTDPGVREFRVAMTTDKGSTWSTPTAIMTVTNAFGHIEHPCLYRDANGQWWLYYSIDFSVIVRSRQLVPGDWDSWDAPEVILSKGNGTAIGEPSLSANGDLAFVLGTQNLGLNDTSDVLDLDPWLLPRRVATSNSPAQHSTLAITLAPNPAHGASTAIRLAMPHPGRVRVQVFDALGHVVARSEADVRAGQQEIPLGLASLAAGVYTCHVTATGAVGVCKLIRQ